MKQDPLYKFTIKFENGACTVKKITVSEEILPFMVMKLRSQYRTATITWEGSNGKSGSTEIGNQ